MENVPPPTLSPQLTQKNDGTQWPSSNITQVLRHLKEINTLMNMFNAELLKLPVNNSPHHTFLSDQLSSCFPSPMAPDDSPTYTNKSASH